MNRTDYNGEKEVYKILCRIDYREHKPFDKNCALRKE
jgi:hypothetical protein